MAFASGSSSQAMSDINVTPLVDVLLVLLIIFMVTAPTLSYPIDVTLPQRVINPPPQLREPPPPIKLRIDESGTVYWNDSPVDMRLLEQQMKSEVNKDKTNQPLLEIDMSVDANYEVLAKVLAKAKNAQMEKIGFVQKE